MSSRVPACRTTSKSCNETNRLPTVAAGFAIPAITTSRAGDRTRTGDVRLGKTGDANVALIATLVRKSRLNARHPRRDLEVCSSGVPLTAPAYLPHELVGLHVERVAAQDTGDDDHGVGPKRVDGSGGSDLAEIVGTDHEIRV